VLRPDVEIYIQIARRNVEAFQWEIWKKRWKKKRGVIGQIRPILVWLSVSHTSKFPTEAELAIRSSDLHSSDNQLGLTNG
jgi:hypothetical protein